MSISTSLSRFADYYRRRGVRETIRRIALGLSRALFSSRMALFYCDLSVLAASSSDLPSSLKVERKTSAAEISPVDFEEIISFWNPKLAHRNMKERFGRGASLWLIKSNDKLAGYGWSLQGSTIEPHYFLLGQDDVHLFDFHVFPQYRGRGFNPLLVTRILQSVAAEGAGRAWIEAAEWNSPQLSSLRKTPFRWLGLARKWTVFGRTVVCWGRNESAPQITKVPVRAIDNSTSGQ